jgi:hypothetical protein
MRLRKEMRSRLISSAGSQNAIAFVGVGSALLQSNSINITRLFHRVRLLIAADEKSLLVQSVYQ